MDDEGPGPGGRPTRIWDRPEPAAPRPLTRAGIVAAAVTIADHQGIAAVTLRNVGSTLDVGPMRLYRYVSAKEELLELMVDSVFAEIASTGRPGADWRTALHAIAHRTRRAASEHPWFVDFLGGRPHVGPNALAHLESLLAALERGSGLEDSGSVLSAATTLNAYLIGALRSEASDRDAERESGTTRLEWQSALWPHLERMIATNQLPTFARTIREAPDPSPDDQFREGLDCVLDGIAARLARPSRDLP